MLASTAPRKERIHSGRVAFSILFLLMAVMLAVGLAGSDRSAQAQLPMPPAGGRSKAAAPLTGGRIAFARADLNAGTVNIYMMNNDGSGVTQITSGGHDSYPAWSPDGSKIAFSRAASNGVPNISVVNADGSNERTFGPGTFPAWSPDGNKIAFARVGNTTYDVFVMNSDGSGVTPLTTDQTNSIHPAWSPDGSMIAFSNQLRDGDQDTEIYVMNANGGNQHVIFDPASGGFSTLTGYPAWSSDGQKIAFADQARIYMMNPDGSGVTQVFSGSDNALVPTWSPDDMKIAFQYASAGGGGTFQVWVADANGGNAHNISNSSFFDYAPNWEHVATTTVLVQNEQGTPVAGAQVYTNTQGVGYPATLLGSTDMSGTISLPNPSQGEYIVARSLVYTGTTLKPAHDDWAYHVYLTNINEGIYGRQSAYAITDTSKLTQTVTISRTNALIGFNIVASVEYIATSDNLSQIATGFAGSNTSDGFRLTPGANDYLLDVTDGQMFLEKVTVYNDREYWNDADYQFFAYEPRAGADCYPCGPSSLTTTCCNIRAQSSGDYGTPWNQTSAWSTLIHEFGHYAIGAYDEYYYRYDGDTSYCPNSPDPDYDKRDSIMNNNRNSSEFCTQNDHNPQTQQGVMLGESVWDTLKRNWHDSSGQNRWILQSPIDRGFVDPGPDAFVAHKAEETDLTIAPLGVSSCAPIPVTVTLYGAPVVGAWLDMGGFAYPNGINEGVTDRNGQALVYGALVDNSDVVYARFGVPGLQYTGRADISSCSAITIPLSISLAKPDQPNTPWPTHWLTATADFSQDQLHALLHFTADPPAQPTLYASQGGTNRQQITLAYDPAGHNYSGDYAFDPSISLDFQFEVGLSGTQGVQLFPYTFDAAQFNANGPELSAPAVPAGPRKLPPTSPTPAPPIWDLFPPENMVSLSVSSTSLISGTGVMIGQVDSPAAPPPAPSGLLAAGGPYTIQGENPITGSIYVSLEFQSEYFCGLQAGSVSIYRYNGSGWDALPTAVNQEWHLAAASITQWGIYAVFAQPNTQTVFSDVPAGSTFYNYINWITCHNIASGYQDGTFRPNNNATRGQISKMVANAYQWHLDPPESGGYTFSDVLPGSTFFLYVEAAYREGVVSGYACGGTGEPCDPQHRPYFRPNKNVTRGQLSKIISNGSKWDDTPTTQTFEDVPPTNTFYDYIERMAQRGVINGYACGGPGEPCNPPANRPYFRPNSNATRGQLSKMIYLALQPR